MNIEKIYIYNKVYVQFHVCVFVRAGVNFPILNFGAMQNASNAFHVPELRNCMFVSVCVCEREREREREKERGERVRFRINTIDLFTLVPSTRASSPVYHLKH